MTEWKKKFNGISAEDLVYNPPHYTVGGYESIDVIKAKLSPEEYRGWCKGNVLKYVMRANYKGQHDNDCAKAEFYNKELNDALESKEFKAPIHFKDAEQLREEDSKDPPF